MYEPSVILGLETGPALAAPSAAAVRAILENFIVKR